MHGSQHSSARAVAMTPRRRNAVRRGPACTSRAAKLLRRRHRPLPLAGRLRLRWRQSRLQRLRRRWAWPHRVLPRWLHRVLLLLRLRLRPRLWRWGRPLVLLRLLRLLLLRWLLLRWLLLLQCLQRPRCWRAAS